MSADMFTIGIDLGTTYSVGATYLPDEDRNLFAIPIGGYGSTQNHTLRSAVYFNPESWAIEVGIRALDKSPSNVIVDSKRTIGMRMTDEDVQTLINNSSWACPPTATVDGLSYTVQWAGKSRTVIPEQVGAFVLGMLKYKAEHKFESAVTGAVITVPAYFTEGQKGATLTAARIAGLDVLRILTEPTAAAIHWIMMGGGRKITLNAPLIVLDIGGGTTDISILHIEDKDGCKTFQVLGTAGDQFLGGENINNIIYCEVAAYFEAILNRPLDPASDEIKELRKEIEQQKVELLSSRQDAQFSLRGVEKPCTYTFANFKASTAVILKNTFDPLHNLLDELSQKKKKFPELIPCEFNKDLPFVILLTGGGSRLEMFYERIPELFPNVTPKKHTEPDVACAYGAAILAHKLSGAPNSLNIAVEDVTPMNIGIAATADVDGPDGVTNKILHVATVIKKFVKFGSPAVERTFYTVEGHTSIGLDIYEGDLPEPKQNTLVGSFAIDGLPTNSLPLLVKMTIDKNGVLDVVAEVKSQNKTIRENNIVVTRKGCEEGELSRMITEYQNSKSEQQLDFEKRLVINKLMDLVKEKQEKIKSACITRPKRAEEFKQLCVTLTRAAMLNESRSFVVDMIHKVNKIFLEATSSVADDDTDEESLEEKEEKGVPSKKLRLE